VCPQTADKVVRVESSQSSLQRIVVRCARTLRGRLVHKKTALPTRGFLLIVLWADL